MLRQVFNTQKIGKLTRQSATVVSLPGNNYVKLGGIAGLLSSPQLSTTVSGVGGMESPVLANTLYYVYAVRSGTTGLIASTSSEGPSGILAKKKVGAFQTNSLSQVIHAFGFGSSVDQNSVTETATSTLNTNAVTTCKVARKALFAIFDIATIFSGVNTQGDYFVTLPDGYVINTSEWASANSADKSVGRAELIDTNGLTYPGRVNYESTTSVRIRFIDTTANNMNNINTAANIPFAIANTDEFTINFEVPILGWTATLDWLDY